MSERWREAVAAVLDGREAHATFDDAVADLAPEARGRRPEGLPHSAWELLEHLRIAQVDLLAYLEDPEYVAPAWPDGYWPPSADPPDPGAWDESVAAYRRDRQRLQALAVDPAVDLLAKVPSGADHSYLRTLLVATDHAAYHIGQLVQVRRLLGAWPPG